MMVFEETNMFQMRNETRFRANSLTSNGTSRPSSPGSSSILYDLLTSRTPEASPHFLVTRLRSSRKTSEELGELLDEAIFCFIKNKEFHKMSLINKIEVVRRNWFSIFLLELALSSDINLQFEELEIQLDCTAKSKTLPTRQCAIKLANFVSLCRSLKITNDEYGVMKDTLLFHQFNVCNENTGRMSKMTNESQLRLGQLFLMVSDFQKIDQLQIIQLLFDNVEKPIQRIYSVLTNSP